MLAMVAVLALVVNPYGEDQHAKLSNRGAAPGVPDVPEQATLQQLGADAALISDITNLRKVQDHRGQLPSVVDQP